MRAAAAAVTVTAALALLAGCRPAAERINSASPPGSLSTTDAVGSTSAAGTPAGAAAATAGLAGESSSSGTSSGSGPCTGAVGSQLRERTTVSPSGVVTMLAGSMPCQPVGVWISSFALDDAPSADPTPRFAGAYSGAQQLSARLPPVGSSCSAAAVYFAVEADTAAKSGLAAKVAAAIRTDLLYWPANQSATVPGAVILQGRASGILAAAIGGDPGVCSPGPSLASPTAAVGDCWIAGPTPPPAAGTAGQGGFRKTTCGAPHTHEVYWAENLTAQAYLQDRTSPQETASAWARRRANAVCVARRTALRLAGDVGTPDVALELLWPSALSYPPASPSAWSKAQAVCLVRWKDDRASDRHILHR